MNECPTAEMLAVFAEGRRPAAGSASRRDVQRHLAGCGECALVVARTVAFLDRRERRRWPWFVTYAAAAAISFVAAVAVVLWRDSDPLHGLRRTATASTRSTEGHLDGFAYSSFDRKRAAEARHISLAMRTEAEALIRRSGSIRIEHARGVASLLVGKTAQGVAILSRVARQTKEASAWNDLAVGEIAAGATAANRRPYAAALVAADTALAHDPAFAAAHFNRALALEHLARDSEAIDEYRRAAALERRSGWSAEARARADRLEKEIR